MCTIMVDKDSSKNYPEVTVDSLPLFSTKKITLTANCFGGRGVVIDTGVHVNIPENCIGYIIGRNDLNIERGIICPALTIEHGYIDGIKVKLYNLGSNDFIIPENFKIAQLIILPLTNDIFLQVNDKNNFVDTE